MPLVDRDVDLVALARREEAAWVGARHDRLTAASVDALHAAGVKVFAWTANAPRDQDRLAALGVDAVGTDDPQAPRAKSVEGRESAEVAGHYNRGACPVLPASTSRERCTTCRWQGARAEPPLPRRRGPGTLPRGARADRGGAGLARPRLRPPRKLPRAPPRDAGARTSPTGCAPSAGATCRPSTGGTDGAARSSTGVSGRSSSTPRAPSSKPRGASRSRPVRARLARAALDWRWSSAPATAGLAERPSLAHRRSDPAPPLAGPAARPGAVPPARVGHARDPPAPRAGRLPARRREPRVRPAGPAAPPRRPGARERGPCAAPSTSRG